MQKKLQCEKWKKKFVLSGEVDDAIWVPALEIEDKIFPDRPGNIMFPLYRQYLKKMNNI